jgi:hypothetical protein
LLLIRVHDVPILADARCPPQSGHEPAFTATIFPFRRARPAQFGIMVPGMGRALRLRGGSVLRLEAAIVHGAALASLIALPA